MPAGRIRTARSDYFGDIQKTAASIFPKTFLDTERIAQAAGEKVLTRIRIEALTWVARIAVVFTLLQFGIAVVTKAVEAPVAKKDFDALQEKIDALQTRLFKIEQVSPRRPHP